MGKIRSILLALALCASGLFTGAANACNDHWKCHKHNSNTHCRCVVPPPPAPTPELTKRLTVKLLIPVWAAYRTCDQDGSVDLWSVKPVLTTDSKGLAVWKAEGLHFRIVGGVPDRRWVTSLRRIR